MSPKSDNLSSELSIASNAIQKISLNYSTGESALPNMTKCSAPRATSKCCFIGKEDPKEGSSVDKDHQKEAKADKYVIGKGLLCLGILKGKKQTVR